MFACLHLLYVAFYVVGSLIDFTAGLRLVEVRIPNYVIKGATAQLECLYDLDGEALYSVKWYKDGNEFYRYVPRDNPPAQTFRLPGVAVDLHNSSDAIVNLHNVNLQSAGRFRCEVSGEAPSFQTVTEHGDMVVVSLPDQGPPKIIGGRPRYQIGDWVRINCTAGRSKPAVNLTWYVNGEPAEPQKLRKFETIVSGREGLETSVLGLQFRVEQHHFRNGDMKLKCVAALSSFYWRSNEESVEGDRPQKAPVLESRESDSAFASNSRADPVQGMSYREIFVTKILSLFLQPNAASNTDSLLMARAPNALLLLALALAATLAGGSLHSNWPAFRHSKAGFGPRVRVHRASINVVRPEPEQGNDKPNDKLVAQFIHVEQTLQDSLSAAQRRQLLLTAR
ncbi:PREDICTED: uncharacterized protein LOC108611861 isoform X1 [Drosophila arizonae]|uniref:Uncharacterized protein LOC108611861 isoform X1 n=1 Tax=Drosophila arizonae TaxID=7263 RepID=A0ABM1NYY5_DROAR|nr:PREDICTED: uncharacterized protein LOC108611861 isoform X1 [Drosophila arizonae]